MTIRLGAAFCLKAGKASRKCHFRISAKPQLVGGYTYIPLSGSTSLANSHTSVDFDGIASRRVHPHAAFNGLAKKMPMISRDDDIVNV